MIVMITTRSYCDYFILTLLSQVSFIFIEIKYMMIRTLHGYTTPENAIVYEQLLKEEVFKEIKGKNIHGFKGIQLLRKNNASEVEFMTMMAFDDIEAVKQFAGEDYEKAYVPDAARKILSRFDDKAVHYELVLQPAQ